MSSFLLSGVSLSMRESNKKRGLYLLSLLLIASVIVVNTSLSASGREVDLGDFIRLGIGARPFAMGSAYVAVGGNTSTTFWNPAAMTKLKGSRVGGMYTDRFSADITFHYLSGVGVLSFGERNDRKKTGNNSEEDGWFHSISKNNPLAGTISLGLTRTGMNIGDFSLTPGEKVPDPVPIPEDSQPSPEVKGGTQASAYNDVSTAPSRLSIYQNNHT